MLTKIILIPNIISSSAHQLISSQADACLASFCFAKTRSWKNNLSSTKSHAELISAIINCKNSKAFSVTAVIEPVEMTLNKGHFDRLKKHCF